MAYDEASFQKTIEGLKDSLVNETSTLNTNLSAISSSLNTLTNFTLQDKTWLKELAVQWSLHTREQKLTTQGINQAKKDSKTLDDGNKADQKLQEGANTTFEQLETHSIKQLTLLDNLVSVTEDIRMFLKGGITDSLSGHVEKTGDAIRNSMPDIAGLVSSGKELQKTGVNMPGWGVVSLNDPSSPEGTNTGKQDSKDSAEVEDQSKTVAKENRMMKMLKGIGESLKGMAKGAGKVAKGGLIAFLTAIGLTVLIKVFQSEGWKKFAKTVGNVLTWLLNANPFIQIAAVLAALTLAFKPLLLWKGAKMLGKGVMALVTKSGRAGIADKVGGLKDKVGGWKDKLTGGVSNVKDKVTGGGSSKGITSSLSKSGTGGSGGGWTKSLASGTKNIGKAMKNIGKGAGDFFMMLFKGIARGLKFLGNPKVLLGAASLGVLSAGVWIFSKAMQGFSKITWKSVAIGITTVLAFGAMAAVAGMAAPLLFIGAAAIGAVGIALIPFAYAAKLASKPLQKMANVFTALAKVSWTKLLLAGPALAGIAAGFVALSGGGMLSSLGDAFSNLFSSDPIKKMERIAAAAPGIEKIASAFGSFGYRIKGFMNTVKSGDFDFASEGIKKIVDAFDHDEYDDMMAMAEVFDNMSKVPWGQVDWNAIDFGKMMLKPMDDKTLDQHMKLLDKLIEYQNKTNPSFWSKVGSGVASWVGFDQKAVDRSITFGDKTSTTENIQNKRVNTQNAYGDAKITGAILGENSVNLDQRKSGELVKQTKASAAIGGKKVVDVRIMNLAELGKIMPRVFVPTLGNVVPTKGGDRPSSGMPLVAPKKSTSNREELDHDAYFAQKRKERQAKLGGTPELKSIPVIAQKAKLGGTPELKAGVKMFGKEYFTTKEIEESDLKSSLKIKLKRKLAMTERRDSLPSGGAPELKIPTPELKIPTPELGGVNQPTIKLPAKLPKALPNGTNAIGKTTWSTGNIGTLYFNKSQRKTANELSSNVRRAEIEAQQLKSGIKEKVDKLAGGMGLFFMKDGEEKDKLEGYVRQAEESAIAMVQEAETKHLRFLSNMKSDKKQQDALKKSWTDKVTPKLKKPKLEATDEAKRAAAAEGSGGKGNVVTAVNAPVNTKGGDTNIHSSTSRGDERFRAAAFAVPW
jgi:hypothetical protein